MEHFCPVQMIAQYESGQCLVTVLVSTVATITMSTALLYCPMAKTSLQLEKTAQCGFGVMENAYRLFHIQHSQSGVSVLYQMVTLSQELGLTSFYLPSFYSLVYSDMILQIVNVHGHLLVYGI